jgi:8-oxo-dGTP pyrophosphatase MutT (NUDIX family)
MLRRNKVYAYITRGDHLLVFRQVDFPEAGIQIPGGTIEDGEEPDEAVLREAFEETGLVELRLVSHLASDEWVISSKTDEEVCHLRHFYHLICEPDVPDSWLHDELHPSEGPPGPITFEFFWLPIAEAAASLRPYYVTNIDKLVDNISGHSVD